MQNALLKNNALLSQLKSQLRESTPRVEGRIKATDKGFGFLETEDGKSYFVPPPQMKLVLHGDLVRAALHEETDKKGEQRQTAEPEELLEASLSRFIGRIQRVQGKLAVVPDHPSIKQPLKGKSVSGLDESSLKDGDWVVAFLERHPLKPADKSFFVEVTQLIATAEDHYAPWWVILARHDLPHEQPVIEEDWTLTDPEGLVRQDLTAEAFFTIDSDSTLDMDDALAITPLDAGGWELKVAIADPSAYVLEGSAADIEARTRAFTLYLPARTVTMLPKTLSDDLCSLMEGQKRPALVASIRIDAAGNLVGPADFTAAWIQSSARLDYQKVSDWLEGQGDWQPTSDSLTNALRQLQALAATRLQWRHDHALVFRDQPDYRFVLDADGKVTDILAEERRVAHKMVEEAMLLANTCAADLLAEKVGQGIYNVHQGFDPEKIGHALKLIEEQGLNYHGEAFNAETLDTLAGFRHLRLALDDLPSGWLDARLRKDQGYSLLSILPGPHFGLGLQQYATWTSPIRKYGDLVNHRLIKAVLAGVTPHPLEDTLTEQLTAARRINRLAERDVKDWLYARFLSEQIGERFDAEIISINRGGLRARLQANGAVVFVPASSIHAVKEEMNADAEHGWIMIGDAIRYRLTDRIQVELSEVKVDQRSLIGRLVG
ncbi:exoribonuclease II [Marinospirillum alkaliphilum]|uniref:Exoribonuclease II n=1 Tax=Marinospirillum alkaliphilum DSM 21637 TaxID=1122209 RepID=A0A1K1TIG9_9GAMM|nr:exoribonuclease II [Marinospirillum alkaliphilum]SFX00334.1 exoribonuclease-2 [Marinospirillum alkaliphilum DSM 21637]